MLYLSENIDTVGCKFYIITNGDKCYRFGFYDREFAEEQCGILRMLSCLDETDFIDSPMVQRIIGWGGAYVRD